MGFAETFKALSDPARREILLLLRDGRMSAGEIAGHFEMTGATVSYHLSVLKKADLVFETREKNFIYYELNTSVVEEVMLWLSQLKDGGEEGAEHPHEGGFAGAVDAQQAVDTGVHGVGQVVYGGKG